MFTEENKNNFFKNNRQLLGFKTVECVSRTIQKARKGTWNAPYVFIFEIEIGIAIERL
jgi:hypothetical protein